MQIESTTNPQVKAVRRLHRARERRTTGKTLLEGPKLLDAALEAGVVPLTVYTTDRSEVVNRAEAAGAAVFDVARIVLEAMSTTVEPQDPLTVIETPPSGSLEQHRTVVLVDISDPGNMGTLIRTAAALGWHVALLGGADPWSPKVLRSGVGAHFTHPLTEITSLSDVDEAGLTSVATVVAGGVAPEAIATDQPVALLVGSEAHGLPDAVITGCSETVTIPMSGATESLNAAASGAIAMYALSRSHEV
ncbi:MAG: RNA methyltransferase [Actinomycetota bacterium]